MPDPSDQPTRKMPAIPHHVSQETRVMPAYRAPKIVAPPQPVQNEADIAWQPRGNQPQPAFDSNSVVLGDRPDIRNVSAAEISDVQTQQGRKDVVPTRRGLMVSTLIVMGATIVSRFLGLAREAIIAAQFGTTNGKGVYDAAFRIPDTLYLLIIGGALGSALIPVFSNFTTKGEMDKAWRLANAVITSSLSILIVAAVFAFALAPQLTAWFIAPGYNPTEQQEVANLTRILLFSPIFLGLGGIAMALLNSQHRFTMPAIAPLIYNVCIIFGALLLGDKIGVYGLAVGVVVGAVLYVAMQIPELLGMGLHIRLRFDRDAPGLRQIMRQIGPRLIGQAAFQINFIVITAIASIYGQQIVAAFGYGFILMMLPHGIFALSVATVTFPSLSTLYNAGKLTDFRATFDRALRQIVFFALPCAVGLAVMAQPITRSLYQLGRFDEQSTAYVSGMIIFFAIALVPFGVIEICTRAFYAMQDTRTPVIASVSTVAINVVLCLILSNRSHDYLSLPFSLALTNLLEMVFLYALLRLRLNRLSPSTERTLFTAINKMVLASAAMGLALWLILAVVGGWLESPATGKILVIIGTLFVIGLGAATYAPVAYVLRLPELDAALGMVLRRFKR